MIPIIDDFLDRRAKSRTCDRTWLDVCFVALPPSIIAILTVSGLLTRDHLWLTPVLDVLIPLLCALGVIFVLRARMSPERRDLGFRAREPQQVYRYCSAARTTAKIALIPMIGITTAAAWASAPNIVRGRDACGYVCNADGTALSGYIQVIDRNGEPLASTELDDRGFFFVRLKALRTAPVGIEVLNSHCVDPRQTWDTTRRGTSCPRERVESPQTGIVPIWIFTCR